MILDQSSLAHPVTERSRSSVSKVSQLKVLQTHTADNKTTAQQMHQSSQHTALAPTRSHGHHQSSPPPTTPVPVPQTQARSLPRNVSLPVVPTTSSGSGHMMMSRRSGLKRRLSRSTRIGLGMLLGHLISGYQGCTLLLLLKYVSSPGNSMDDTDR